MSASIPSPHDDDDDLDLAGLGPSGIFVATSFLPPAAPPRSSARVARPVRPTRRWCPSLCSSQTIVNDAEQILLKCYN
eukprot:8981831-Karenia_brevis.AAC.1